MPNMSTTVEGNLSCIQGHLDIYKNHLDIYNIKDISKIIWISLKSFGLLLNHSQAVHKDQFKCMLYLVKLVIISHLMWWLQMFLCVAS